MSWGATEWSTLTSAVGTAVIAGFAVTNYILARELKSNNEKNQKEMNKILKAIVQSNNNIAFADDRRKANEELKELRDKNNPGKKFISP